jgi:hypothetical protein
MSKASLPSSLVTPKTDQKSFNYNKLQAVLCIAASAAVSVTGLYWIASVFL